MEGKTVKAVPYVAVFMSCAMASYAIKTGGMFCKCVGVGVLLAGFKLSSLLRQQYGMPGFFRGVLLENTGPRGLKTAEEIVAEAGVNLAGRTALITGANSGIGKETARVLASQGVNVVMCCRTTRSCEEAIADIKKEIAGSKVQALEIDLSSFASIRAGAKAFLELEIPLHFLVLNAGVMMIPTYLTTREGFELQFGVNHMGHWLLTSLLLDKIRASAPGRIVSLSSIAHKQLGRAEYESLFATNSIPLPVSKYNDQFAYGISKTANILFATELRRRLAGTDVQVAAAHPGMIKTGLDRYSDGAKAFYNILLPFVERFRGPTLKTIPQGAATTLYCLVADDLSTSVYYADSAPATEQARYYDAVAGDARLATEFWTLSERLAASVEGGSKQ